MLVTRNALECLNKDRDFLTRRSVFRRHARRPIVASSIEELTRFRMTTHPVEFDMYYSRKETATKDPVAPGRESNS